MYLFLRKYIINDNKTLLQMIVITLGYKLLDSLQN